jgi:multiple sugar transport system substrate-binding protein
MRKTKLSRREFLAVAATTMVGAAAAACSPAAPAATTAPTQAPAGPTAVPPTAVPATNPPPKEVVTVEFYNGDPIDYQVGYQAIVDAFNASRTDIKMEVKNVPGGAFDEKLLAMIAAGDGPDMWMKIDAVSNARHGHFENVTPWLEKSGYVPADHWFDLAWKIKLWEGNLYSTPRDVGWAGWSYNKDIFDAKGVEYPKDGWSLQEFVDTALKVTDAEQGIWGTGISGGGSLLWGSAAMPFNMGFEANSPDGKKAVGFLDSPLSIEAIQFVLDLQEKHKVAPSADALDALGGSVFGSGKVALGDSGTWDIKTQMAFPFAWEPLHAPVRPGEQEYSWGSSVQYYMWSGADNKEQIWEALLFASSEPGSGAAHAAGQWLSPCPSVWAEQKAEDDKLLKFFLDYSKLPIAIPAYEREQFWECIGTPYFDIWTRYLESGERPLADIVKDAAAQAQVALDEAFKTS